jgi:spore germination protein GerM
MKARMARTGQPLTDHSVYRAVAALVLCILTVACTRHVTTTESPQITIYYCRAGSDQLVHMPFTVDPKLAAPAVANYALGQLVAGPSTGRDQLVLFPAGTVATVSLDGDLATVNLDGPIARSFQSGAGDEAGLFKSLTYTMTGLAGIQRVQVTVSGVRRASLPGGHFELDEPLTRDTFAQ